jgi:pimeloyl-ACP methyl ester carboxylesterase
MPQDLDPGSWDRRSEADRRMNMDNALANVADQLTARPRTPFTCEMAKRIAAPALLTTGERSPQFFHRIMDVLEGCLARRKRRSIPGASHSVAGDNAKTYQEAVLSFLVKH